MMNALPQASTPPHFATFLTAIGQAPAGGDGDVGFEQMLAAVPGPTATDRAIPKSAPPPPSPSLPTPMSGAAAQMQGALTANSTAVAVAATEAATDLDAAIEPAPRPAKSAVPPAAEHAAALAANQPVAAMAKPAKPEARVIAATDDASKGDEEEAPGAIVTGGVPHSAPDAPVAPVAAAPTSPMPANTAEDIANPVAEKPAKAREAAQLPSASTAAEPATAKPATIDAGPSMAVLFQQSVAPAAATVAAVAPAAIADRVLDMSGDDAWIEQLASDIVATRSDRDDISFRLMPRHLGRLDVAMRLGDEGVSLKMDTQHEATATIVTAAQSRLVEELRQQGVRVAGAEVTHTPSDPGRQSPQGQDRGGAPSPVHLIETGDRADARSEPQAKDRADDGRSRFA